MKKALITGVTGQDGSYLAEFLLESAELSAGKPGGLGERSPSRQDGEEEEEEGAMLNARGRG